MANLFKRISDVIAANLNDLVDRVEDPERMLHQLICDMEEELCAVRESVAAAIADEIHDIHAGPGQFRKLEAPCRAKKRRFGRGVGAHGALPVGARVVWVAA